MIERKAKRTARIGVFAVVQEVYFEQFEGLKEKLFAYHNDLLNQIRANDAEVIDFGFVGSNAEGYETAKRINGQGIDLLMCNMITYATSSVFAPIILGCDIPMILLVLQPLDGLDYTKASTFMQLENDNICAVPEFVGVAERLGRKIHDVVIGTLYNDSEAQAEIAKWCNIAMVLHALKGARIGLMGHTMEAMYDMHADPTAISAAFGIHVPLLEIDDAAEVYGDVTDDRPPLKRE